MSFLRQDENGKLYSHCDEVLIGFLENGIQPPGKAATSVDDIFCKAHFNVSCKNVISNLLSNTQDVENLYQAFKEKRILVLCFVDDQVYVIFDTYMPIIPCLTEDSNGSDVVYFLSESKIIKKQIDFNKVKQNIKDQLEKGKISSGIINSSTSSNKNRVIFFLVIITMLSVIVYKIFLFDTQKKAQVEKVQQPVANAITVTENSDLKAINRIQNFIDDNTFQIDIIPPKKDIVEENKISNDNPAQEDITSISKKDIDPSSIS